MTAWALVRLVKFGAMAVLGAGMAGAMGHAERATRLRWAYTVMMPAFVALWTAGYVLMQWTDRGFEPWILVSMTTSLITLYATLEVAHRPTPHRVVPAVAWGALASTFVWMGLRDTEPLTLGVGAAVAAGAMTLTGALAGAPKEGPDGAQSDGYARDAILWVGRLEGTSLLLLLAVAIGRRVLDVDLGMGPRVLGWVHGALVLIWLQVLASGGRALGWSWGTLIWGFVSALLPFGTFVFERGRRAA